jgi:MoxR-like ATPase
MASKARPLTAVDLGRSVATVRTANGSLREFPFHTLPKVERIAFLRKVGYGFRGNPMHMTDADLSACLAEAKVGILVGTVAPRSTDRTPAPVPAPKAPEVPTPAPRPKVPTPTGSLDEAIRSIVEAVIGDYVPEIDPNEVGAMVAKAILPVTSSMEEVWDRIDGLNEAIAKVAPKVTEVIIKDRPTIKVDGVQHAKFGRVLSAVAERTPSYLFGPAGTGKSTIGENCAKALGLDFFTKSCSSQMTESSLLGYNDANGRYVAGIMRAPFEFGGVFVLDEVDNANPNILSVLNSAIANGIMAFPDGMVRKHEDFVLIATANTVGNGATQEYVGRNPLDKAFLDRFVKVEIGYDEAVEDAMLASVGGLDREVGAKWLATVRTARKNVSDYGLKVIVSPRATLNGAKLLRQGVPMAEVAEMAITAGMSPDQSSKVLMGVTL